MSINWIDFTEGCIEFIFMSLVVAELSDKGKPKTWQVVMLMILTSTVITTINSFDLPYHAFITIFGLAGFSAICLRRPLLDTFTDSVMAFAAGLIYQITCELLTMGISHIIVLNTEIIKFVFLILMVIIFWMILTNQSVQQFLSKHYYPNRRQLLWFAITVMIISAVAVNMWASDDTIYRNTKLEVSVLIAIYIIFNFIFLVNLDKKREAEKRLFEAREYEDYLHEVMEEMNSREHEYKNQMNHIMSIAKSENVEDKVERIIDYTERIADDVHESDTRSTVTDNIAISIFLYQIRERAKKEKVDLEYYIDKPFPEYKIPEKDIMELLQNAVNNAFEAVATMEPEKRHIYLTFQHGFIEISNTINHVASIEYGVSTKGNNRGYGMQNMKRIADKYNITISEWIEGNQYIVNLKM